MIYGVDVHMTYQAGLDIESLAREGYDFCIVKATEGSNGYWAPPGFESWQTRIRQAGMINGAYHWCTPGDPIGQVDYFLRRLGDHRDYPIIQLDIDTTTPIGVVGVWVEEWKRRTNNHPVFMYPEKPTTLSFFDLAGLGPIWDSHYVAGSGYGSVLYEQVPDTWWRPDVEILQFSSHVTAGGLTANVDGNVFQGSKEELLTLATRGNTMGFQPNTPPTDQEIADLWWWFFNGTAAFGDLKPEDNHWHGPTMWKETHDAAISVQKAVQNPPGVSVVMSAQDKADIAQEIKATIASDIAEAVFQRIKGQFDK